MLIVQVNNLFYAYNVCCSGTSGIYKFNKKVGGGSNGGLLIKNGTLKELNS